MHLFPTSTYVNRRKSLMDKIGSGKILITGNTESPMNYKDNIYRFRQDSNFRYFFGINLPNLHGILDCDSGESIIFGNEYTMDDIIWIGPHESLQSLAEKVGIKKLEPLSRLEDYIHSKTNILFTPPYRHDNMILLGRLLGLDPEKTTENASIKLIKAIVDIRSYKSDEEIVQMSHAVNITRAMHKAAMRATRPGKYEYEVVSEIHKTLHRYHAELAYPVIFSVNGQVLHNHSHENKITSDRLILNDSGAENSYGYAGDITRTFPANGRYNARQKEIYELVLKMEKDAIASLKPGVLYRDIHIASNKTMLEGLKSMGLVKGDIDEALAAGVGGLFMPHGLGHMIGMDVHDMEDLGEQYVGYSEGLERSTQLGLKSLRLARKLEAGFVLTVEPGLYFIPQLIDAMSAKGEWKEFVNYDALESYKDFGGVRIEDNVLITDNGYRVLGDYIPKEVKEIEELMNN